MKNLILLSLFVVTLRFNYVQQYYPGFKNVQPIKQNYYYDNPYKLRIGQNPGVYYSFPNYSIWIR